MLFPTGQTRVPLVKVFSSEQLTSRKHSQSRQSPMLGLEPLKQRRQGQDIEQRVEESKMDEWKCIQSVHYKRTHQSAPALTSSSWSQLIYIPHTRRQPNLFWDQ